MSKLRSSLRQFLAVEGVRTVAVIDIGTGMIVRSAGKPDPHLAATAVCVADEARAARAALGAGSRAGGDLVEITTVTGSRLQVTRILPGGAARGLLLFVDLERGKSNIGLAALRIGELSPAVLALPGRPRDGHYGQHRAGQARGRAQGVRGRRVLRRTPG